MVLKPVRLTMLACLLSATFALAHEGATGVVKERMDLMKRQQDDMKLLGDMAKGKTSFDAVKAAEAARDVSITAKKIHELFPEGSAGHPSDALPSIWKEWDRFAGNATSLESAADELASSIDGNAAQDWKAGFQKLTDACKSCHQDFRAKKKESEHH